MALRKQQFTLKTFDIVPKQQYYIHDSHHSKTKTAKYEKLKNIIKFSKVNILLRRFVEEDIFAGFADFRPRRR